MTWQERINRMFATAVDIKTALINNFTTRISNGTLREHELIDVLEAEIKKTLPVTTQPLVEVTQAQVTANPELALSPNVTILSSTSNLTKTVNNTILDYNQVTGAYEQRYHPEIASTIVAAQALQGVVSTINQFNYGTIGGGGGGASLDTLAPQANGIMSIDNNSDTTNGYQANDAISINFNEPIATVLITINDISINNSHVLGTGATLVANNPSNGHATRFDITLGTSPSVAANDILSVGIGKARDIANNANVVPISYIVPTIGTSTGNVTAPAAANMSSIVITDTNNDSTGTYNVGDLIAIRFTESISTTLLTIIDVSLNNGHNLGSNVTMLPNNAVSGYASEFVITLGGSPTIATGDVLSIAINKARGMNNNYNTVPINFTVPVIGGNSTPAVIYYAEIDTIALADPVPSGWLLADGSAVSRTTYAELFAAIGTTYGAGDGSTTFNLPNIPDTSTEKSIVRATTSTNTTNNTAPGTTIIIPANGTIPAGYILLDGSWLSIEAYPALYSIYGSTYGIDTVNGLFKLPNVDTPTAIKYTPVREIITTNVSIRAYLPTDTIPAGFILANGATVSRVTYSSIFSAISTAYGVGDGSTTFKLPVLPDSGSYKMYIGISTSQATGSVFYLSDVDAIPNGYLRTTGQELSKEAYPALYSAIGGKYGTASDNTKFKLPNLSSGTGIPRIAILGSYNSAVPTNLHIVDRAIGFNRNFTANPVTLHTYNDENGQIRVIKSMFANGECSGSEIGHYPGSDATDCVVLSKLDNLYVGNSNIKSCVISENVPFTQCSVMSDIFKRQTSHMYLQQEVYDKFIIFTDVSNPSAVHGLENDTTDIYFMCMDEDNIPLYGRLHNIPTGHVKFFIIENNTMYVFHGVANNSSIYSNTMTVEAIPLYIDGYVLATGTPYSCTKIVHMHGGTASNTTYVLSTLINFKSGHRMLLGNSVVSADIKIIDSSKTVVISEIVPDDWLNNGGYSNLIIPSSTDNTFIIAIGGYDNNNTSRDKVYKYHPGITYDYVIKI